MKIKMLDIFNSLFTEFAAMKSVGMRGIPKAVKYIKNPENAAEILEYEANGMSVSEIADLVLQLA